MRVAERGQHAAAAQVDLDRALRGARDDAPVLDQQVVRGPACAVERPDGTAAEAQRGHRWHSNARTAAVQAVRVRCVT